MEYRIKMRIYSVFWFIFMIIAFQSPAQNHSSPKKKIFRMDPAAGQNDYYHGVVQVKIKPEYKSVFKSGIPGHKLLQSLKIKGCRPGVPEGLLNKAQARLGRPFRHDLSLYMEVYFDESIPVEDAINDIYNSGMVDIAEPVYVYHSLDIPNDNLVRTQYYLGIIKAFDAWDISKGDSSIIIGIPDSGVDIDHPDLEDNLFINYADPVDGIDNDNNGYIDDWRGWDFAGALSDDQTDEDNDPSINKGGNFSHGTGVGSVAGAKGNNSIGISGIARNCRLLFTKHYADDQAVDVTSYATAPFLGVLYCASMNADIINCSWGSLFQNQIYQDYIDVLTEDLGILIVAAAGNTGKNEDFYPASYRNVLSVGAVEQNLQKSSYSTYGKNIDLSAPGTNIIMAEYNNNYKQNTGTSFSSPMVAGAAALVKSIYPGFTGYQAGELLRVSSNDTIYQVNSYIGFKNQLGYGILDINKALTEHPEDIRLKNFRLINSEGKTPRSGEEAMLVAEFKNILWPSSGGLEVTLKSKSSYFQVTNNTSQLGIINTGESTTNAANPFSVKILENIPVNQKVELLFEFSDGAYYDYQYATILLNPTFLNIEENEISSTIAENGRLGYQDTTQQEGLGVVFDGQNTVFEMGLMLGTSPMNISNAVRTIHQAYDHDFVSEERIKELSPGLRSESEIYGSFNDDSAKSSKSNVLVRYKSLVWKGNPNNQYFIIEYNIKNRGTSPLNDFHVGLYADWDVSVNGQKDRADWDSLYQIGYVFSLDTTRNYYSGIQVLTGIPNYYAIDNDQANMNNPWGVYDGFTDEEKYISMAIIGGRKQAGFLIEGGTDVSHTVSSGPYTIEPGDSITVAFAIHSAKNLEDLLASAAAADTMYNFTLKAQAPEVSNDTICWSSDAAILAGGASKFNWYQNKSGGDPAYTGDTVHLSLVKNDTTIYVTNADQRWESNRVPVSVIVKANPQIFISGSLSLCDGDTTTLFTGNADRYLWSPGGETTPGISITETGSYSVIVYDTSMNCTSVSSVVNAVKYISPAAGFDMSLNAVINNKDTEVVFTDQSINAVNWYWQLSDGQNSNLQNPSFTINSNQDITVSLTVTAENGCQAEEFNVIAITGLEDRNPGKYLNVYPNPVNSELIVILSDPAGGEILYQIFSLNGKPVAEGNFTTRPGKKSLSINLDGILSGLYILRISRQGMELAHKKIIKN